MADEEGIASRLTRPGFGKRSGLFGAKVLNEDWARLLEQLRDGDRMALAKLTRLVNSFLARAGAYDFRDEWDDVLQEVLTAALAALEDGTLRDRAATVAFLKTTTRFKFIDRLKAQTRQRGKNTLPWEEVVEERLAEPSVAPEMRHDLRRALAALPENQRDAVTEIHMRGLTYEEAAAATLIPLGSLKRHLRDGLARLRAELGHGREKR